MTETLRKEERSKAVHDIILGPGPRFNERETGHQSHVEQLSSEKPSESVPRPKEEVVKFPFVKSYIRMN